jgi:hypothetical protein
MEFFCLCCVLFNSSEHAFVKNSINDWVNIPFIFQQKTTFVGRQRLTCQRPDLNYLAELI